MKHLLTIVLLLLTVCGAMADAPNVQPNDKGIDKKKLRKDRRMKRRRARLYKKSHRKLKKRYRRGKAAQRKFGDNLVFRFGKWLFQRIKGIIIVLAMFIIIPISILFKLD